MPITLDQIVEETSEMPGEVVAELIDRIMLARHGGIQSSVAESWKAETDRRIAEIESGKVKGGPLEESLARAGNLRERFAIIPGFRLNSACVFSARWSVCFAKSAPTRNDSANLIRPRAGISAAIFLTRNGPRRLPLAP